jgi:hypothetical protein
MFYRNISVRSTRSILNDRNINVRSNKTDADLAKLVYERIGLKNSEAIEKRILEVGEDE